MTDTTMTPTTTMTTTMTPTMTTVGRRFAHALAARDRSALIALFADPVDFQGLTPSRHWRASTPADVVDDVILGRWFAPERGTLEVRSVHETDVAGRRHLAYRLRAHRDDGDCLIEQQAYLDVEEDAITWMRVLCSGYRPTQATAPPD